MTKKISNVLKGLATLSVGSPSGNRAGWSNVQVESGDYSVLLEKVDSGDYGSTAVQFTATGNAAAQKVSDFATQTEVWGWSHFRTGPVGTYWEQMELHFEDPLSTAWVDVTVQVDVAALGAEEWQAKDLAGTDLCMFGGWSEGAGSFSNWSPAAITDVASAIETAETAAGGTIANAADWLLTRVKMELWETSTIHSVYIDDIIIDAVTYTLEPGSTTVAGILFNGPWTDVGYTEDGVVFEYTATDEETRVEEETYPIDAGLASEGTIISCNMAESSLFNLNIATSGSELSGSILKLGGGVMKKLSLQLVGVTPSGHHLTITVPKAVVTGAMSTSFRRVIKNTIPISFKVLKPDNEPAVTVVYNAA